MDGGPTQEQRRVIRVLDRIRAACDKNEDDASMYADELEAIFVQC
jgi:hypothetical protein